MYKHRAPAYSIGNRLAHRLGNKESRQTPAPNFYKLPGMIGGKSGNIYKMSPSYSMGKILASKKAIMSPGPTKYLPELNQYGKILISMTGRSNAKKTIETPSPNQYNLQGYKPGSSSPAFTMREKLD